MSRIIAIIKRDFLHVRGNAIALLVCMGLAIMPSFYAWFNIAGGWDPYGNTSQVKVALANSDEGVKGSIVPFNVNVGERVVTSLTGSEKIGYVVTSEDEAIDGVRSGEYYAAVVIPKNFSSNLLSVLTKTPTHPQLDYYVNEKRNPIASIVTGKASGSVQSMIDTGFTEAVTEVATDLFGEMSSLLDDEGMLTAASGLSNALDHSLNSMRSSADDVRAYAGVLTSVRGIMQSSASLFGEGSASLSASDLLRQSADGVQQFNDAATTAKEAASSAIDAGANSVQDVRDAIDNAFEVADGETDKLVDALNKAKDFANERKERLQSFLDVTKGLDGKIVDLQGDLDPQKVPVDIKVSYTLENDLSDVIDRADDAMAYLNDLIDTCDTTISDIQTSKTNAQAAREELQGLAAKARDDIESVRDNYNDRLSGSFDHIVDTINNAADRADEISTAIRNEAEKIDPLLDEASESIKGLEDTLNNTADKIDGAADKLNDIRTNLSQAATSGNVDLVRSILGTDASTLISFLSAPVELEREPLYHVENNGSAMTPYYTTMALWVGGTLMGILLYAGLSKKALEETRARPRHAYFGRLAFFLALGAIQSTILLLGDVYFLGVQCEHPVLFLLTGWLASTVFINIIYSLSTSFGDIGKAVAVFIMVVQVAGSGGTFPVEMLPKVFQMAYPFLPFVHSENAMRSAMFGIYGNDWLMEIGLLAAFLVPALILGLLLRKPFVPVNEWIEEKMEETKLM